MDTNTDGKRKKDTRDDDDDRRRDTKSKRARSRSRSSEDKREKDFQRKRRRRSCSPDNAVKQENQKESPKVAEVKSEAPARRAKETDMLNTRTGGAYIPPARLRLMQAQITDKSSVAYQRLAWEALKKSIHGHINKINVGNIGIIIKELLKENIVRGRGLLCRSVIQAQAASPTFTNVYAALVAAVNSRFPNIGELLLKRLVIQFKRGFKRNDKSICISSASFIAHLVNQRVAHEILALELLTLLVETPTDDSVEVSIAFLKECGQKLTEVSSKGVNAIFEMLRNILHEGQLDKRVQYMIEVMFQVWKDGFKDHPALIEELELVPEEEQFTHLLMLDDATNPQDILNVFKFDEKYEENEQKYKNLSKEILGSDAESGEEDGSGESGSGSEESDDDEGQEDRENKGVTIIDNTETNLVALRRTIYLTINSSLDFEECAHKLMKMQLKPGQEVELCHMFLDCCAEQRTYEKFYGLLAQRFCNINRIYIGPFEEIFKDSYSTAHRLDTNRLRNVSKFFAHLLFTDSISWEALECVKLNEEDTTSSSRIYIKILFQELAEYMGLKKLNDRLKDPTLQSAFSGVFPRNNPKDTRFSINFFTSIGLGGLTDELREHLKQMPKNVPPPAEITVGSSSEDSSSSSSSDSSSDSSDDSEEESSKKKKKDKNKSKKDTPPKTPDNDNAGKNQDVERWGHDGFYETYGKDAQRHERPRNERDKDNFAIPRDVPRKREQRNGDERRRNEELEDPKNRGRDDDRSDRIRKDRMYGNSKDDEEQHRDRKNRNDERHDRNLRDERMDRDRDNYRRNRNESERDSGYESRSKRPNDDDRRDRQKGRKDDTTERDRNEYQKEKDRENESGYESRSKRPNDDERRDREKGRKDDTTERDRNEYQKEKDRENESGYESRSKRPNDDDRRDRQKGRKDDTTERDRNEYQKEKDRENESGYESRSKRPNDDERRDRQKGRKDDTTERDRNDYQKEKDRENESGYESRSKRPNDDERRDREKGRKDDTTERDRNEYQKEKDRENEKDRDRNEYQKEKDRENEKDSDEYEKSRIRRHNDDDRRDRERTNRDDGKDRARNEQNERPKSKKNIDKDNENERKEKRSRKYKEKRSDSDSDGNVDEQSSRRHKRDKDRRKDDSRSKRKSSKREKENESRDGWDIRGNSIRREDPVVASRFWDTYESKKRDTVERNSERYESGTPERREIRTPERVERRTPDKLEKSQDKRRDR